MQAEVATLLGCKGLSDEDLNVEGFMTSCEKNETHQTKCIDDKFGHGGGSESHMYTKSDSKFLETLIVWGYNQYEGKVPWNNLGEWVLNRDFRKDSIALVA